MAKDTLTLTLKGDVTLDLFATALKHFDGLVKALSAEVAPGTKIQWEVIRLESGSALTEIRGSYIDAAPVERVVDDFAAVARSLAAGRPIPYSEGVRENALALTSVLNGHITAIEFIVDEYRAVVTERMTEVPEGKDIAFGVVTGIVNAIWYDDLRLSVIDDAFGKSVACHLPPDRYDLARDVWGKRVSITGLIYRDPDTGRPIEVRQVRTVDPEEDTPSRYSFRLARGIIPWREGQERPEAIIRRGRDAR